MISSSFLPRLRFATAQVQLKNWLLEHEGGY